MTNSEDKVETSHNQSPYLIAYAYIFFARAINLNKNPESKYEFIVLRSSYSVDNVV